MSEPIPVWLATIPNDPGFSSQSTKRAVAEQTSSFSSLHQIEMPGLLVGTLDSLMALSDDIERVDTAIEQVVKKIERQYTEVVGGKTTAEPLTIGYHDRGQGGQSPLSYLKHFEWDHAKYPFRRPLPELVSLIQSGVSNIEDELKHLSGTYGEKIQIQSSLKRKKGSKLSATPLDEILTPEMIRGIDFHDTEYLVTLIATVPKDQEAAWVKEYASLGADIVTYPITGTSSSAPGSPAVPNSATKLFEDGDACLYTVTVLKGQFHGGYVEGDKFQTGSFTDFVEGYKAACKERKFLLREFSYNPEAAAKGQEEAEQLTIEVQQLYMGLQRWCLTQFGEAFIAWMHVKMIRAFVESILRYGLPTYENSGAAASSSQNFITVLLLPQRNREKQLHDALHRMLSACKALEGAGFLMGGDEDEDEGDGAGGSAEKYSPSVLQKFSISAM